VGKSVAGIAINPSTGIAYVSKYNEKTISVIYGTKNGPLYLPSSSTITPSPS
jgi:DNA-binding beta-propeller fold protein YncE